MNLETCCIAFLLPSPRKPVTAHQRRLLYSPGWNFIRGGVRTDNKEKVVPPGEITVGGTRTRLTVKSWHRVAVALTWSIKLHFGTLSFAFSFNYNGRGPDTVYYWIYRKFCRSSERRDRTSRRGLTSSSIEHARRLPCSLVRYPSSPNICFVNSAQAEVNARAIKIDRSPGNFNKRLLKLLDKPIVRANYGGDGIKVQLFDVRTFSVQKFRKYN